MLTPAEAEKLILGTLPPFGGEDCPIAHAHGRVLRGSVRADRDLPPFDRVTMDGYALRATALAGGARSFRIEAAQAAGMRPGKLGPGADGCIEVATGAVLPAGADCVVPYEDTKRDGGRMKLIEEANGHGTGSAVHRRGSDHREGDIIVQPGVRLTGREIAVAAACGCAVVSVAYSPKIAVVATGDELVDVDAIVAAHQIRRSNDYALRAALSAGGFPRTERFLLHDDRHEIEHMMWHIIAEFDVVLITGGVSKGKFDFLPSELDKLGVAKVLQGVAQRPGKPFWFGLSARMTPVFALPGNPVSSYTCLHRYVLPALEHASGLTRIPRRRVALSAPVSFKPPLACLLPVKIENGPAAEGLARPIEVNTSGDFGGLVGTDGFVELPVGPFALPAGTIAEFWPWV